MFTEDYIMRMINQMIIVLASIIGLRKAGQYKEAQQLVNQSLEQLLGLDAGLVRQIDESSLLKILTTQAGLDTDRLYIIAELYEQESYIYFDQENFTSANADFQRALHFYLEIALEDTAEDYPELNHKIKELDQRLGEQALPLDLLFMLFDYYERQQEYGAVERVISRLLDQPDSQTEIKQSVLAYYRGLLDKKDQDLLAGGVSRSHVRSRITTLESI